MLDAFIPHSFECFSNSEKGLDTSLMVFHMLERGKDYGAMLNTS